MSTFIDLDSQFRDKDSFLNPNSYTVLASQVKGWFREAPQTTSLPQNKGVEPSSFAKTVRVVYLTLPYDSATRDLPRVYVQFKNEGGVFRETNKINTINNSNSEAVFVCELDRVQQDDVGTDIWLHYKCDMVQTMRFQRDDPVSLVITGRNGTALPSLDTAEGVDPDPTKQTLITFEIKNFVNSPLFDNHGITPRETI